jgi:hypothetical protein
MIPDITPWSYPNRNTPKETKMLVKYLPKKKKESYQLPARIDKEQRELESYIKPLPVRP